MDSASNIIRITNQIKVGQSLATLRSLTQEAVSKDSPLFFCVTAHPYSYLYDYNTACVLLNGFVPPVSSDAGLLNSTTYTPFLFLAEQRRTSKETLSHWRFVMKSNNARATPTLSTIQTTVKSDYTKKNTSQTKALLPSLTKTNKNMENYNMTTEIQVFNFDPTTSIRTIIINDEPRFVAKDICDALDIVNNKDAVATLKENYQLIGVDIDGVVSTYPIADSLGRLQETTIVTEIGLYDLIQQSRKITALKFKHWISSEVLPSIRKTGSYSVGIPKSLPEALRLYANELEMKELVIKQRDEAVRTKAWIGEKREATSMNTASQKSKENEKLKEQIGESKTYKQVKAISWLPEHFNLKMSAVYSQIGKALSKLSIALGYEPKTISSSEYPNGVKAYHVDVIEHFKCKIREDLNMLRTYRRIA